MLRMMNRLFTARLFGDSMRSRPCGSNLIDMYMLVLFICMHVVCDCIVCVCSRKMVVVLYYDRVALYLYCWLYSYVRLHYHCSSNNTCWWFDFLFFFVWYFQNKEEEASILTRQIRPTSGFLMGKASCGPSWPVPERRPNGGRWLGIYFWA